MMKRSLRLVRLLPALAALFAGFAVIRTSEREDKQPEAYIYGPGRQIARLAEGFSAGESAQKVRFCLNDEGQIVYLGNTYVRDIEG